MKKKNNNVLFVLILILIVVIIIYIQTVGGRGIGSVINNDVITPDVINFPVASPITDESTNDINTDKTFLMVVSPNGGESIKINQQTTLKWNQTGLNDGDLVNIAFRDKNWNVCWAGKINGKLGQINFTPNEVKCSTGSTFTSFRLDNQYILQIVVEKFADGMGVADQSDSPFTIVR